MNKDELIRVLTFYADPQRYKGPNQIIDHGIEDPYAQSPEFPYLQDVTRDEGQLARRALAQLQINGLRDD